MNGVEIKGCGKVRARCVCIYIERLLQLSRIRFRVKSSVTFRACPNLCFATVPHVESTTTDNAWRTIRT